VPESAQWPHATVDVPVGEIRAIDFVADNPGDWAFHCHKSHHTMNQMGHGLPNLLGVDAAGTQARLDALTPGTMVMGTTGMGDMTEMAQEEIASAEAELTLRVTDELTLGASYAYTDVKVPATPNPFLGNVLFPVFVVFTPPNAASAFVDYELPLGNGGMSARFHLDANYADATYSFQAEPVKTDSSFIVNGRVGLSDIPVGSFGQSFTLSLWARNLQKDYGPFAYQWTYGASPTLFDGKLFVQVLQRDEPVHGRGRTELQFKVHRRLLLFFRGRVRVGEHHAEPVLVRHRFDHDFDVVV
jgi:hypothetical protein